MALGFGRKKTSKDTGGGDAVAGQAQPKAAKPKKRKPNEMLSSVIKESTEGAAIALMRENENFLVDDGRTGVVLLLDVTKIGGLSQKQRGDEAKGSIIELIQADHITTLATAEMLDVDVFGIIPTPDTVERMDEYDLLVSAPYTWGTVDLGSFEISEGAPASFADAKRVAQGLDDIASVMGLRPTGGATAAAAPASVQDDQTQYLPSVDDDDDFEELPAPAAPADEKGYEVDEDAPFVDDDEFDDSDESIGFDDDEDDPFDADTYDASDDESFDDGYDDEQREGPVSDRVVTEQEVRDTVARRYMSGDLGLVVDLQPFEAYLGTDEPIVLFSEEADHDDWLGNQIAQMAKQANVDIARFHQDSIAELRQQYLQLASMHVDSINRQLDPDDPNGIYGSAKRAAQAKHKDRADKADQAVSEFKRELTERFEAEAEEAAQAAALAEKRRYKDRNRPRLDRELSDVAQQVAAQNDEKLAHDNEYILVERRNDAAKRMDLGLNKILEALADRHREVVAAESELFRQHSKRMQDFLDDNRKEDIARTEALQAQLARDDEVQRAHADYTARMDAASAEHTANIARLTSEVEAARNEMAAKLAENEAKWAAALEQERQNTEAATKRAELYASDLRSLDERKDQQYKERIEAAQAEVRRSEELADRSTAVQNRASKMLALVGLMLSLAALAIGILLGSLLNRPAATVPAPAPAVTQTVTQQPQPQPTVTVTAQPSQTPAAPTATATASPSR